MNKLKYTPNEIAYTGMALALIMIGKFITFAIPDLPGGAGSPIMVAEAFILMTALVFGKKITFTSVGIYLLIVCWIAPATFIGGIYWVDGNMNRLGVYFFDYFLPYLLIASMALAKDKKYTIILVSFFGMMIVEWFSHTMSGYIFFSQWRWDGWGPFGYSAVYNLIRSGLLSLSLLPVIPVSLFLISPYISKNNNSWI